MPKLSSHIPKYSRHQRGQAFVKVDGRQIWLGRYGDPASREKYDRFVAQWLANGRVLLPLVAPAPTSTVRNLLVPYWSWAKERYTAAEVDTIRAALNVVERLYGSTPALQFGPNALRTVRSEMIRSGWTRRHINRQVSRVRALFRWAASHEMLPETVCGQLRTVEPLRRGEAP
ncbi:hypothetical protein [Humisphaera borealis]|uniref:Core-binding (CB) domain-containing protein n=1 Tax=Humisphaera borealis TaxID=2807512 RepID=A0A7M2WXS2_9BACT|nr:hypothetical protein [Humisphaera borealis]QOV90203.1 hypothetical protein IPV69_02175 [Humisphaera borealis]